MNNFRRLAQGHMSKLIKNIKAREVIDSRGNPTVEAEIQTNKGVFRAIVPSGASTGTYEAIELRDEDKRRFKGKGVLRAVKNINDIIGPAILKNSNISLGNQKELDAFMVEELDGTKNQFGWNKSKLGANAILAVSMAFARASAKEQDIPLYQYIAKISGNDKNGSYVLPVPCFNVLNGGQHAGNTLAHQEFMIMPTGVKSFKEAVRAGSEIYQTLKGLIKKKYGMQNTGVGDEGGFAPQVHDEVEALEIIYQAIKDAGYEKTVEIGLDVAASELWNESQKVYNLDFKDTSNQKPRLKTGDEMLESYLSILKKFPIVSIEDPFDQQDWPMWTKITQQIGEKIQIVGDDNLVTNTTLIKSAIDKKACNALLLKLNQIGSVSESIDARNLAKDNGWGVMVSHRSGETEDDFIADLVVGLRTGEIKSGSICRGERTSKYNQLIRIEEEVGDKAIYAGKNFRGGFDK